MRVQRLGRRSRPDAHRGVAKAAGALSARTSGRGGS
jgi:hypothetical protein